jgi:hypothetical protein
MLDVGAVRQLFRDATEFTVEVEGLADVRTVAHALALFILCDLHEWSADDAEAWLLEHRQGRHILGDPPNSA